MASISVYASMTPSTEELDRSDLDRRDREFGFFGISYHYVIRRDGEIEPGRPRNVPTPHQGTVAVVLVGGTDSEGGPRDNFTDEQKTALVGLLDRLQRELGGAEVISKTPSIHQKLLDDLFNVRKTN